MRRAVFKRSLDGTISNTPVEHYAAGATTCNAGEVIYSNSGAAAPITSATTTTTTAISTLGVSVAPKTTAETTLKLNRNTMAIHEFPITTALAMSAVGNSYKAAATTAAPYTVDTSTAAATGIFQCVKVYDTAALTAEFKLNGMV